MSKIIKVIIRCYKDLIKTTKRQYKHLTTDPEERAKLLEEIKDYRAYIKFLRGKK